MTRRAGTRVLTKESLNDHIRHQGWHIDLLQRLAHVYFKPTPFSTGADAVAATLAAILEAGFRPVGDRRPRTHVCIGRTHRGPRGGRFGTVGSPASLSSPTVLRGSLPSTARPVPICPPGYTRSPDYRCIGPSDGDYTENWPSCNLAVIGLGRRFAAALARISQPTDVVVTVANAIGDPIAVHVRQTGYHCGLR
jgi:hypothetical protein